MSKYIYYLHTGPGGRDEPHFNRVPVGKTTSEWLVPPHLTRKPWRDYGFSVSDLDEFVSQGHGKKLCVGRFKRECEKFNLDWSLLL